MTPRKAAFVRAYLANGGNATQAAIAAGYSARSAGNQGGRMMKDDEVLAAVRKSNTKVIEAGELTAGEVLREYARIVRFDPGKLVNPEGGALALHEIDEDTRRAIGGVEVEAETEKHGRLHKFKPWSKTEALRDAARIHGLFEKDNQQVGQSYAAIIRAATAKRRTEKR